MKNIKILSVGVILSLTISGQIPVSANDSEYKMFSMREMGNAVLFADDEKLGELKNIAEQTGAEESFADEILRNYPAKNMVVGNERPAKVSNILNKQAFDEIRNADGYIYDREDKIPFDITTDADKPNGIAVGRSNKELQTLELNSDTEMSALYMYTFSNLSGSFGINMTVTYDDNSEQSQQIAVKSAEWNQANTTEGIWGKLIKQMYEFKYNNGEFTECSVDASRYQYIYEFELDVTKKVKSISFVPTQNADYGTMAIIGITGKTVTEEEKQKYIVGLIESKISLLPTDINEITEENYRDYKRVIEEIYEYKDYFYLADNAKLEILNNVNNKIEDIETAYKPYMTVDFKDSFNAGVFADPNKTVPNWNDVSRYISAYRNIDGEWIPATSRALNRTAFENAKASDGLIYSSLGVPFKTDCDGGLAYGGNKKPTETETIKLNGINAEKLHFYISPTKNTDSSRENRITINYSDKTSTSVKYSNNGIVNGNSGATDNYIAMNGFYITNENGTPDGNMRSVDIVTIDADFSKTITSLDFYTNDGYGGWAVIGITAEYPEKDKLLSKIDEMTSMLGGELYSHSYEINSLSEMIKHYEKYRKTSDTADFSKALEYIEEYNSNAVVIEKTENITDYNNLYIKVYFKNEIGNINDCISLTVNGANFTDYTAIAEKNILTVKMKNDLSYDKRIALTVKSGLKGKNEAYYLVSDYTYTFVPYRLISCNIDGIYSDGEKLASLESAEGKKVTLKGNVKNENCVRVQKYLLTAALINEKNKFVQNYVLSNELAEGKEHEFNFDFDVSKNCRIVIFILDDIENMTALDNKITIE